MQKVSINKSVKFQIKIPNGCWEKSEKLRVYLFAASCRSINNWYNELMKVTNDYLRRRQFFQWWTFSWWCGLMTSVIRSNFLLNFLISIIHQHHRLSAVLVLCTTLHNFHCSITQLNDSHLDTVSALEPQLAQYNFCCHALTEPRKPVIDLPATSQDILKHFGMGQG